MRTGRALACLLLTACVSNPTPHPARHAEVSPGADTTAGGAASDVAANATDEAPGDAGPEATVPTPGADASGDAPELDAAAAFDDLGDARDGDDDSSQEPEER
jgi:hypothetical protein